MRAIAAGRCPRPCIAEMGGKNAGDRLAPRQPRRRGDRHHALGLRPLGPEVLGVLARLRRTARRRRASRRSCADDVDRSRSAIPPARENWMGPVIDAAAVRALEAAARRRCASLGRRAPRRRRPAARPAATSRTATSSRRPSRAAPPDHPLWQRRAVRCPSCCVARGRRPARKRCALANDSHYGLTAGFYGSPTKRSGSSSASRPVSTYANRPQGATHRRLAGLPALRRLEGLGLDRQGGRLPLLPAAVPARAVADAGAARLAGCSTPRSPRERERFRQRSAWR